MSVVFSDILGVCRADRPRPLTEPAISADFPRSVDVVHGVDTAALNVTTRETILHDGTELEP